MMRILSPHLDDAVLSLGQYLATGPGDVEVITALAGIPPPGLLTDYDRSTGFSSSREAMWLRLDEDAAALGLLGVGFSRLGFFDQQYRPAGPSIEADLTAAIEYRYTNRELMFAPIGIGHPDHRLVADCAREAIRRHAGEEPVGLLLYEELPYRVLHPEEVHERLDWIRHEGWDLDPLPWPLEQGDRIHREIKAGAIAEYRSQFPDGADDPCLLVPERVWRITR